MLPSSSSRRVCRLRSLSAAKNAETATLPAKRTKPRLSSASASFWAFSNGDTKSRGRLDALLDDLLAEDPLRCLLPVEVGDLRAAQADERVAAAQGVVEER